MELKPRTLLALAGALLLALGVFSPLVTVPMAGAVNLLTLDGLAGGILLAAAVVSLAAGLTRRWNLLWYAAGIAGGFLLIEVFHLQFSMLGMRDSLKFDDGLAGSLGNLFANAVQLSWGVPVLVVGLICLFAAAALKDAVPVSTRRSWVHPAAGLALLALLGTAGAVMGQQERVAAVAKAKADSERRAAEERTRIEAEAAAERTRKAEEAAAERAAQVAEEEEATARQEALNNLEFTKFEFASGEYSDKITGELTNNSDRVIHGISVKFNLLDANDNIVGDASDFIDSLKPEETWVIEAGVFEDDVATAQYPEITGRAYEYAWDTP